MFCLCGSSLPACVGQIFLLEEAGVPATMSSVAVHFFLGTGMPVSIAEGEEPSWNTGHPLSRYLMVKVKASITQLSAHLVLCSTQLYAFLSSRASLL